MRRLVGGITAVVLAAVTVVVSPLFRASSDHTPTVTVASESFEVSATNWDTWLHDSTVSRTATGGRSGSGALSVAAGTGASVLWYLPASTFTPGVTYTFSVYAKLTQGSAQTIGSVQSFDAGWKFISQSNFTRQIVDAKQWRLVTGAFRVPMTAANVNINLSGPKGSWLLDDATITMPQPRNSSAAGSMKPSRTSEPAMSAGSSQQDQAAFELAAATVPESTDGSLLRPFVSSSLWNSPLAPGSRLSGPLRWPVGPNGSWWLNIADANSGAATVGRASDPVVTVVYNYTGSTPYSRRGDQANANRWGRPANASVDIHIPVNVTGAGQQETPGEGDGALVVLDPSAGIAYNFWQFTRTDASHATASAFGSASYRTDTGWGVPSASPTEFPGGVNAGVNAAGSSEYGGMITGAQIASGTLGHALAMQCDMERVVSPGGSAPAIWSDGRSAAGFVHEGDRLAIPPATARPASVQTSLGSMIWDALTTYGAYCIDIAGGTNTLVFDSNSVSAVDVAAVRGQGIVGTDAWASMGVLLQKVVGAP